MQEEKPPTETMEVPRKEMERLMAAMAKNNASDMHLKTGGRPIMRIAGIPRDVGTKALTDDGIRKIAYEIMTEEQIKTLESRGDVDMAHSVPGVGRFRLSIFRQRGAVSVAVRRVNVLIPNFEQLRLPSAIEKMAQFQQGLVLVIGVTGSGKSTTLASMIEYINQRERLHIVTIEDPIEYVYRDKKAFINQREIGIDVSDFHTALKSVVRQDPDVILCGELRDSVSIEFALSAAETGHLVFGTLHASNASQCVSRILDLFPPERHEAIRQGLIFNLKGLVAQRLLPSIKEEVDRVPAVEIMFMNPIVQKLIREKEDKKIQDVIRASGEEGMMDFNQSLVALVRGGLISKKIALDYADNPDQLTMNLKGIFLGQDKGIAGL